MKMNAADIERKAAQWIVLGSQPGSDGAQSQLEVWLEEDPRHRAAYLRLQAAWNKTARLKSLRGLGREIDKDLLKIEIPRPVKPWMALAAVVAIAAVGIGAWLNLGRPQWQTHTTEPDGFARVTLKDGSTVDLNGNSEVRVRMTAEQREVALMHGEAHFIVARDAVRPFTVAASGKLVRAVGTAFSVRIDAASRIDVLVTEGRVAVGASSDPNKDNDSTVRGLSREHASVPILSAGEAVSIDNGVLVMRQVTPAEVTQRLAWAAGRLYFAGETLGEAVAEFNRYTTRKLTFADPELAQLRIGGNFRATDTEGFVSALGDSFGVQADILDEKTIRLKKPAMP